MDEDIVIPVTFNGKELEFPARLLKYGYTYKLEVDIGETKVHYELDDERNWRAQLPFEDLNNNKKIDTHLLKAIAEVLEEIMK